MIFEISLGLLITSILVGLAVAASVAIGTLLQTRARRKEMADLAKAIGASVERPDRFKFPLSEFALLSFGVDPIFENVIRLTNPAGSDYVTDLYASKGIQRLASGNAKGKIDVRNTMFIYERPSNKFPSFRLAPRVGVLSSESIAALKSSRMGRLLFKDFYKGTVDLTKYPRFAKQFIVYGEDQYKIDRILGAEERTLISSLGDISVEASGKWVVLFFQWKQLKAKQIELLLPKLGALVEGFTKKGL